MHVKLRLNDEERDAELAVEDSCLVLVIDDLQINVDRRVIREAMNKLGVGSDRNMWWDGYQEALRDAERMAEREFDLANTLVVREWLASVRAKFGIDQEKEA
jgi:hypothetical protein